MRKDRVAEIKDRIAIAEEELDRQIDMAVRHLMRGYPEAIETAEKIWRRAVRLRADLDELRNALLFWRARAKRSGRRTDD